MWSLHSEGGTRQMRHHTGRHMQTALCLCLWPHSSLALGNPLAVPTVRTLRLKWAQTNTEVAASHLWRASEVTMNTLMG